ncbi:DUF2182 domain-containing protein [Haloarcula onubensis]|uniref:DUF2182 domain-containing protein n=1 Tax=Haloarcula onubensis TaxID=2950539 RepID=A0ABU2FRK2_9EURY|nr:DUF2182 domain-containing protein [Halomicroarcula sp. S3CR25-11]MDS0283390.1 DUF2182 domain-containing protein [Halomicroarcula sp. S3CR25-11]
MPVTTLERLATRTRRSTVPVALATYVVAALAWLALVLHDPLEYALLGHAGHGGPGVAETVALTHGAVGVGHYLLMWGLMMVAMMYPSSAAAFQWYADRQSRRTDAAPATAALAFVASYTLLWVAVGVVPLAVVAVVPLGALAAAFGPAYLGVALLAVGGFQLSGLKRRALQSCRSPAGFLPPGAEDRRPVRLGWQFGRQDVAACGVLMGLMVAVGSMNLGWMALVTGVLSLERLSADGQRWARWVGYAAVGSGVALVAVAAL